MIALYGLTADPPHNGHVRVVSSILDADKYNRILIHVSYKPKYKKPEASFQARFDMADLSFSKMANNVHVILDRFEYTSNVVKCIKRRYDGEIHFFTGYDWDISKFHDAEYLMKNVKQVKVNDSAINRHTSLEKHFTAIKRGENTRVIRSPVSVHSSTIRNLCKEGIGLDGLVPEAVNRYIKQKGLYGYK